VASATGSTDVQEGLKSSQFSGYVALALLSVRPTVRIDRSDKIKMDHIKTDLSLIMHIFLIKPCVKAHIIIFT
jgi:hypothetical protein